ncbi:MAG: VWA domain-containing protein [Vicinamibacterales bacterium]
MRRAAKYLSVSAFVAILAGVFSLEAPSVQAQAPAAPRPAPIVPLSPQQSQPTFRVDVDLVTTDVIVRDAKSDQFIADLKAGDFDVFEDGVKQELTSMVLVHGGRAYNSLSAPPPPVQEGIILPVSRPTNDTAGRVFLLFVDDLHLDFQSTPRTRDLFKRMLRNLIHEGDMFGIVSTGTSSLSIQLTYDRQVLDDAIKRITGGGMKPADIVTGQQSSQGPTELRYRAHVAFSTAYDLMKNLEKLHNRRKAVIWVSSGYDFNPFERARMEEMSRSFGNEAESDVSNDPSIRQQFQGTQFAMADLARELADVTKAANRANATLYTIDPRGLVAGPDIDDKVLENHMEEWNQYVRRTQDSLRTLAEETGGIAVVNQNDFDKALKRIDAETSDYYVLGYYSSNPDPLKKTRRIEVKTKRDGVTVWSRTSYSLRPTPAAAPAR